jgi:hypothetical protein
MQILTQEENARRRLRIDAARERVCMSDTMVQLAYDLLTEAAAREYKTARGAVKFVTDVKMSALVRHGYNWHKTTRRRLVNRTVRRPVSRAAMFAFWTAWRKVQKERVSEWMEGENRSVVVSRDT